jgi:hypothetical protein
MAKTNEEFDRIFREKLEHHQQKPSALAWERLNNQLPASKSTNRGIWWAVAASVSILIVAGWVVWNNSGEMNRDQLLAEENTSTEKSTPSQEILTSSETPEVTAQSESEKIQITQPLPTDNRTALELKQVKSSQSVDGNAANSTSGLEKTQLMIAVAEQTSAVVQINTPPVGMEINEVTLPEVQPSTIHQTVAEASPADENEPLYRVNIYSDGLKKGPEPDKNLITEMGKTVGKVEGLLGKVDEGFAELQDKKNNLFATLTSKK